MVSLPARRSLTSEVLSKRWRTCPCPIRYCSAGPHSEKYPGSLCSPAQPTGSPIGICSVCDRKTGGFAAGLWESIP